MSMMMMRPSDSTPICRCRVLYLGSAVPHITKDGLQGIQEPLKELYPEQGALGARGIDSWLSVWSNGLLLENVDENHKKITRFFPIESLHYCAAVRFVLVPEKTSNGATQPRFLPLDSPFARSPNPNHPPLFAAILRRTSGIKVLECHTFICKREMAANALVRCCFHAYADSSYAKQSTDGGGTAANSIYGTLRTNRSSFGGGNSNTIEKVEGWRRMTNGGVAGSTLTLNSAHSNGVITAALEPSNSIDDLSECNGDENHKVWVGSTRDVSAEKEELYAGGNTMRSSRSSRPRQIVGAAPPPPPPPPPTRDDSKGSKKSNKQDRPRRKRTPTGGGSREDLYAPSMNGSLMRSPMTNGRSSVSLNGTIVSRGPPRGFLSPPPPPPPNHMYTNGSGGGGTMLRPMNGYHHPQHIPHPGMMPPPPPPIMMVPTTLPHPKKMHKMKPAMIPMPRPGMIPPNFMPMPMYVHTGKKSKHMPHLQTMPMAMEEPIYMPSARPLSPVASYQPEHFPHEAYLMQQYANNNNNNVPTKSKKQSKKDKKKDSIVNGGGSMMHLPMMMQQPPPPPPHVNGHRVNGNGVSAAHDETDDTEDSVYSTGIYRRKGHLNERAFSYSIRQEHRSRSYGSLANLKFAAPPIVPNGIADAGSSNKVDMKKEREIMQMMQDLELSGDELDRADLVVHQKKMQNMQQRPVKTKR